MDALSLSIQNIEDRVSQDLNEDTESERIFSDKDVKLYKTPSTMSVSSRESKDDEAPTYLKKPEQKPEKQSESNGVRAGGSNISPEMQYMFDKLVVEVRDLRERVTEAESMVGIRKKSTQIPWRRIGGNVNEDEGKSSVAVRGTNKWFKLSPDLYTLLATSKWNTKPFWESLFIIFGIQMALLALLLVDQIDSDTKNPLQLPANVQTEVIVAQALTLIIAVFRQDDMLLAIEGFFGGRPTTFQGDRRFENMNTAQWYFSQSFRFIQGFFTLFASFILLIKAESVIDIMLDFLGVTFISNLDDMYFGLGERGYLGNTFRDYAEDIVEAKFSKEEGENSFRTARRLCKKHTIGVFFVLIAFYTSFMVLVFRQNAGEFTVSDLQVEFGDDVLPFLGAFNGCYKVDESGETFHRRFLYVQVGLEEDGGKFGYCNDFGDGSSGWTFFYGDTREPCDNYIVRSGESKTFDIIEAADTKWYTEDDIPLENLRVSDVCGKSTFNVKELCSSLTLDVNRAGFTDASNTWSESFDFLKKNEQVVEFYDHPVFVGESSNEEDLEIIYFTGRRWIMDHSSSLLTSGDPTNKEDVIDHFEKSDLWLLNLPVNASAFVSEAVDNANDQGTPLGLRWFTSLNTKRENFHFATDISRPVDSIFRCGICNSESNPCLFEGTCLDNGECACKHGADGKLCEIKPLGDGVCQPYFNVAPDQYDGGDCCAPTCSSRSCGVGDIATAFGQNITNKGTGFPHCRDSSLIPLSIQLNAEVRDLSTVLFQSYKLEVRCKNGEEVPLNVQLDPSITGELNETIYVSDESESCAISFSGIQSGRSGLNISLQVFDESLIPNSASIAMIKDDIIVSSDSQFDLPAVYVSCLKAALANSIDLNQLYSDSYQDKAVAWLDNEIPGYNKCENDGYLIQRYALVAMSLAETAPNTWIDTSKDQCSWSSRVTCKDGEKVLDVKYDGVTNGPLKGLLAPEFTLLTHLEYFAIFNNADLTGTIPSTIGSLTSLTYLSLPNNKLSGPLPSQLGSLPALNILFLSGNQLTGTIPREIASLSALEQLYIDGNDLTGGVPKEISGMTSLQKMWLYSNPLGGTIPSEIGTLTALDQLVIFNDMLEGRIPTEIGGLTALKLLLLNDNTLTGSIPNAIYGMTKLEQLDVVGNHLTGSISSELNGLTNLVLFSIADNMITGFIPSELSELTNLKVMKISNNFISGSIPLGLSVLTGMNELDISGNRLTGSIPSEFGAFTALTTLNFFNNTLGGTLPSQLGGLTSLMSLAINYNGLIGQLPPELGALTDMLQMTFSNNQLTGSLPPSLGAMTDLSFLDLNDNSLTGSIPSEFGNLTSLQNLYMMRNRFSGTITTELGRMTSLVTMALSDNGLTGQVPSELGLITSMTTMAFGNNQLTGQIPSELSKMTSMFELVLEDNLLTGSIPTEFGTFSSLASLRLFKNMLGGKLPSELGLLPSMFRLKLGSNGLTGQIPSEMGMLALLSELELEDNLFTGSIPTEFGNLSNLASLQLFGNNLQSTLPTEIGQMRSIFQLVLGVNQLTGSIPSEIGYLTSMGVLQLSGNKLSGEIPTEFGLLTNLLYLDLRDNNLDVTNLPTELDLLTNLQAFLI